jgi:putative membrane-bound dehydrogenase-like protein
MRVLALAALILLMSCGRSGPPYSAKQALATFRIAPGYHIERFAEEPDVVSPVAMDIDEDGRIYVVEDRGYPLNSAGKIGRVKLLEDTNDDGMPDRATIFADNLVMPTGVMRWKKGILVTDAPDLLYLEDTNGDGRADVRRVVLTGFAFSNPQHTVNSPMYGLDNWIYVARPAPTRAVIYKEQFGDTGHEIRFAWQAGVPPLTERVHDIRFRMDPPRMEALSGETQFGQTFDDWGHRFIDSNSNHARHEVIAARYLKRNPDLPVPMAHEEIPDHGAAANVYPITLHPRFEMLSGVGVFTSACGITWYQNSLFVAEPVHNLVHRDLLRDAGSTYIARRDREGVEFLASTDAWFRPVNMLPGPDGALYLMDFYRLAIEHPEWMSDKEQKSDNLTKGIDRGRIYRIVPDSGVTPGGPMKVRLSRASDGELAAHLASPHIWYRRTAQRLLLDRQAVGAVPQLEKLFRESPSAVGRLHALWTLEGLGKLQTPLVEAALGDQEAGVRENALILAEPRLKDSPQLTQKVLALAGDSNPKVQFQALSTLGAVRSPAAADARDKLLLDHAGDKWFQIAALSSSSDDAPRLFAKAASGGRADLLRSICAVLAERRKPAEIETVARKVAGEPGAACLEGLARGFRGGKNQASAQTRELLLKMATGDEPATRHASLRLLATLGLPAGAGAAAALKRASALAGDEQANGDARGDAVELLAIGGVHTDPAFLEKLMGPREPEPVQLAAVRALGRVRGDEPARFLLASWRGMSPKVRAEAADAMVAEAARARMLAQALDRGEVQPWTLAVRQRNRLIMNNDPEIRAIARRLLGQSPADRQPVVDRYMAAIDRKADAARGKEVFKSICAKCHRLRGQGKNMGPDLGTVTHKPKPVLLEDILIPSQSIAQGYESYVVEVSGAATLDGVLGEQSANTITLRHEDGKEDVIQRKDIKEMYATNLSAMPGDLEKQIDIQQMADLLAYLKEGK